MCMYPRFTDLIFKEAKEAKKVFKVLENVYYPKGGCVGVSPYQGTRYVRGQHKHATIKLDSLVVYEGLHAYSDKESARRFAKDAWGGEKRTVVTMVIPRGAIYAEGSCGEIVSTKLHWPDPAVKRRQKQNIAKHMAKKKKRK